MSFNPSLIALSIASLRRRALKNLSLLIALVIVIFTATSILFTADSIQRVNKEQIGRLPDITMQRMVGGRLETIEEGRVDELLEIEGVEWAIGRIWGYYFFLTQDFKMEGRISLFLESILIMEARRITACPKSF